mmetsp:Transcript_35616/g.111951  ORF Transcript_35616/g.111951 Transcript_35616/m.111951 type:complete len:415 (+) Transcript_35616:992-2236(+)
MLLEQVQTQVVARLNDGAVRRLLADELRDVGEDVEGALWRAPQRDAIHAPEGADHKVPLLRKLIHTPGDVRVVALGLGQRGDGRLLRDAAGAARELALQLGTGLHHVDVFRREVSQAVARHGVGLAKAVHHERAVLEGAPLQRGEADMLLAAVDDALVDLIGQHPDSLVLLLEQHVREAVELRLVHERAGGVHRVAQHDELRARRERRSQLLRREHKVVLRLGLDHNGRRAREARNLRVGRPVGRRDDHLVAGAAERKHRLVDGLLRAITHEHLVRPVRRLLAAIQVVADGLPQARIAGHARVLGAAGAGRLRRGLEHVGWRGKVRLTHAEAHHFAALGLERLGERVDLDGAARLEPLNQRRQRRARHRRRPRRHLRPRPRHRRRERREAQPREQPPRRRHGHSSASALPLALA